MVHSVCAPRTRNLVKLQSLHFWRRMGKLQIVYMWLSYLHNEMPESLRLKHLFTWKTNLYGIHISLLHISTHLSLKARRLYSTKPLQSPAPFSFSLACSITPWGMEATRCSKQTWQFCCLGNHIQRKGWAARMQIPTMPKLFVWSFTECKLFIQFIQWGWYSWIS